jgi:phosphoribosylformylglycinamidine cyclo-ligase
MAENTPTKYASLGVDVGKRGINVLQDITDDLFPNAFCSVIRHPASGDKGLVLHEDGVGSKPLISYLCYRETGQNKWFEPLASDAIAMNIDDVICIGAMPIAFSDYVALNSFHIKREALLGGLAKGFTASFSRLRSLGHGLLFSGGETADLPDIVQTFDLSGTVYGEVPLAGVITGETIEPGDQIVGLRSGGGCTYEERINSGIMCNGITLARHCLLDSGYLSQYPEIGGKAAGYSGKFKLGSEPDGLGMTVAEALLSPTRIFLPIIAELLKTVRPKALVHNTGGGLAKCKRLGRGILFVKDQLPDPDPIFSLIQQESGANFQEMCQDFNMGVGFEVVVKKGQVEEVLRASERFGVGCSVIGHCERSAFGNSVLVKSKDGSFTY